MLTEPCGIHAKMEPYLASDQMTVLEAFRKIDANRKGFLIITDAEGMLLGTLTDGDIRRTFLKDGLANYQVCAIYTRGCVRLNVSDGISAATELFKNESIKFLPIVDDTGRLVNLITRKQLRALLLQDLQVELDFDFSSLDEGIVDYEIFQRPWGFYKTTVMNDYFQSKIISVKPKGQLSLQSHCHREEYWIVAHGTGVVQLDQTFLDVRCGSSVFIPKGCRHRLTNTDETESLIITEVQIGDYFGEDDIIRYEDIYGRV